MNSEINLIPQLNFWSVLLIVCAGQAFFLSLVFFFHKKGNIKANRILAVLIFCFSFYFVFIAAYWSNYLVEFPHLVGTLRIFNYSWGPLFYLYISEVLEKNKTFNYKKLLHFIPAVISISMGLPLFLLDTETKVEIAKRMLTSEYDGFSFANILPAVMFNLHILFYTTLSILKLNMFSKNQNGNKTTLESLNYNWLIKLSFGFTAFFLSWFCYEILMSAGIKYHIEVDYAITFFGVIIIYLIAIYTMKQPEIFSGISNIKPEPKYEKSSISKQEAETYLNKLNEIMKDEKLYLNPELNIRMLADLLEITPHKFSQLINEFLKINFSDYLNNYRIEEAKERLVDPEYSNYTILSIAYDVGFNNKVSFNNAFKKITGMTPSEYKFSKSPHFTN